MTRFAAALLGCSLAGTAVFIGPSARAEDVVAAPATADGPAGTPSAAVQPPTADDICRAVEQAPRRTSCRSSSSPV